MAERDYLAAIRDRVVVFDGGMGATLEAFDLDLEKDYGLPGRAHEVLVLNRPDVIEDLHRTMVEAGAEVVETDTFQASRLKLEEWGLAEHTLEINRKACEIARRAIGEDRFVAGSIGPTGHLPASDDPTLGSIRFRELVEVFEEQARGLLEGGCDLIIIETAQDILEVKAAVFGTREAFAATGRTVPIQCSVSLLPNGGKMLLGTDIASVVTTLEALDVDVIGLNCSTGPEDMRDAIRYLGEHCTKPIHCIPNAGLPQQGADGETIFPEEPEPLATALAEFVREYGVNVVGGCCGTTPEHIRAIADAVDGLPASTRPEPRDPFLSSMIASTELVQTPRPTIVGERVNSQGSRRAKELLLEEDYDTILQIAEDQVEGGAHVLDVCVALTEKPDEEGEQMREVVKRISLTQPSPIQVDSTEPDVIATALDQIPGRAIVNSINLEAGRDKLDTVVPIAKQHGAAVIALTIDEVGMAKTADRKIEVAKQITEMCEEHGFDRRLLVFDLLTFTLTTGDEEWRPSAVETIEAIRRIQDEIPGVKTSLGVSNVSFGVGQGARAVLNSVFLHHCVEAGLSLAMVNPNHITPVGEIDPEQRELAENLVWNRSPDALEKFINFYEGREEEAADEKADPTEGMTPEEALHFRILKRKKDGVEGDIDAAVEKLGAVPVLNDVLLPAMKEVGDKFGAGELILPFVLQSAEVMKRAVAQLENYLERTADYTKGTVVLATVFGDVHDIGKSLVNTILSNNGYTVIDLGKQVPVQTIVDAAAEHQATAVGLSALLVSTSKQMPLVVQELHEREDAPPILLGGAAINRAFGYRAMFPKGKDSDEQYEPGVFYCKDAFEGLSVMDQIVEDDKREALLATTREKAIESRNQKVVADDGPPVTDDAVRSPVDAEAPVPEPPFWGVREIPVEMDEVYHHLDTHVLFKLHWGGRGIKGEAWRTLIEGDADDPEAEEGFRHKLERMWREQDYLHPRALLGFFPCYAAGNDVVVLDPEDRATEINRFVNPRQPKNDRLCTADFFRPGTRNDDGTWSAPDELDVIAIQALTVGSEVTDRMARLEQDGEYAEQLFTHGFGVQVAEGLSEWLHWKVRGWLDIPETQGRRLSWGYPAVPDQAEHEKVRDLLDISQIGMTLTGGYSPEPEQSTLAMIVHHPQATYYGMRNGRFLPDGSPDNVIIGSERDPTNVEAGFLEAEVPEGEEAAAEGEETPAAGERAAV